MVDRCGRTIVALEVTLAAFLVLAFLPPAWAAAWKGSCDVRFRGTSTLHDFEGNVRCQPFRVGVGNAAEGKTVVAGTEVAVLAGEMDTGNKSRDRQMREMFQADKFPRIRVMFGDIDSEIIRQEFRKSADGRVPLDFALKIRDIERPVHAIASNFRETGGTISFDVEFPVSLKEYRLVPPKVLFGVVRVDDRVTLTTAVRLEASGPN